MLIASITSRRTGRMSDVVATIQAEQDRVIRAALQGVLVVQGGPGTGKTVAALHRAAYLLYTHRRTLERRGVLVIGPNATFLRYISQVLPSLGETDVVLSSIAELFPGVKAAPDDDPEAAVVKGDEKMVERAPPRGAQPAAGAAGRPGGHRGRRGDDGAAGGRRCAPATGPAGCASRTTWPASCSSPSCSARSRAAEARALGRELDPDDVPYARARLWDEPPVRAALDGAVAVPDPAAAGRRAAGRGRCPPPRRSRLFLRPNEPRCSAPAPPTRGPWRTCRCSTRPPSCSAPTTPRTRSAAPGRRAGAPGRGAVRPGGARDHRPGRAGLRGRRHPGRLEPRPGPAAHHGRTGLGRPLLGLRPRDRGRGAGAVRDGLADGDAPDPDPVA